MTKWVLEKNRNEIIDHLEYSASDHKINGLADVLWSLIPPEMTLDAEKGQWDYIGYTWRYDGDIYTIRTLEQN